MRSKKRKRTKGDLQQLRQKIEEIRKRVSLEKEKESPEEELTFEDFENPRKRRRTKREMELARKSNFVLIEKGKPGRPKKEATA